MMMQINCLIAEKLNISQTSVDHTIALLRQGCTIPFISRYRKEMTNNLDEVAIGKIEDLYNHFGSVQKRKTTIISTIESLGKLTNQLRKLIDDSWDLSVLEDLYLPFKPKLKTRAQTARENGLEALAELMWAQRNDDLVQVARRYISEKVPTVTEALKGAMDIVAEKVNFHVGARQIVRNVFTKEALIISKVVKGKENDTDALRFRDYFDFCEPLHRCRGNRFLALRRGEAEGILKVRLEVDSEKILSQLKRRFIRSHGACSKYVSSAIEDAYRRLLRPSRITSRFLKLMNNIC